MLDVVADKTAILAATLAVLVNWSLPVHTRRMRQEPACPGRLRQPSLAVTLGGAVVLLKALVH